ncbi:FadR/GntR family transcriptional regulator [Pseudonocardia parietis]|uniref:DNA-binding FadR family transcriptional regulator n=1 Tax=Pseudonocardia parietis TaxID=570936 RepID=A0ABS4VUT8_9PSEU|nr:FCD domain-containing protein [Pseudonocardia parietis]MBP2367702.1 DNA-binding FadR family transcriptional regulator [Pseudonocardia parietis]
MTSGRVTAAGRDARADAAPISGDKMAARVARSLEDEIIDRGWPVGEVLGSETELRERFGVSRAVFREAVRLVEHHQVGRMRRGPNGGLVVTAPDAGPATRALVIYLEFLGTSVEDLLAARLLLEPLAARLAAETVTEDGITALREVFDAEAAALGTGPVNDDHVHTLLGRLSGNPVLQLFTEVLISLTYRYARTSRRTSKEAVLAATTDAHRWHSEIIDAVISGDAAAAETHLVSHLRAVEEWLLAHRVRTRTAPRRRPLEDKGGSGRKLAEVVAERMHDDIAADGWQIGSVFGSETDLLERYGVSRAVLREAVRLLEHHSVARMRRGPGGGLVVAAPDPTASIHTMALRLDHLGLSGHDLRVVREAVELGCVTTVTAAVPAGQAADRLQASIGRAGLDGESGDVFHAELAELAGNPVLVLFLRIITELWSRHSRTERPPDPSTSDEVRRVHQAILDAVLAGDTVLARHRVRRHLQALTTWWH